MNNMNNKILISITIVTLVVVSGCQQAGNSVAFTRLTGDHWQIWTARPDGSNTKQITASAMDKRYPVWPKNDRELFFRTNNNQTFCVDLDSGCESKALETMGLNDGVIPSPDGSKLLVVKFKTQLKDSGNLWLTTLDGKDRLKILTRGPGLHYNPTWSPDSGRIAYIDGYGYRSDELYIMDSDGKNKCRLTNNKAIDVLPDFSPDGKRIAYVSDITGNYEIWLIDSDGGNPKQLTDFEGIDTKPSWSPDGRKIMFVSDRGGPLQLWVMDSNGGNVKQLTTGNPSMDPAWRKD